MGCMSSKLADADLRQERELLPGGGIIPGVDYPDHIVSLTSSTYGVIKLDHDDDGGGGGRLDYRRSTCRLVFPGLQKKAFAEEPEVINAWELMEDLDDGIPTYSPAMKKRPGQGKTLAPVPSPKGVEPSGAAVALPRKQKLAGKENFCRMEPDKPGFVHPARVLKPLDSLDNTQRAAAIRFESATAPKYPKIQVPGSVSWSPGSRRSFSPGPLFDPELIAAFEKEHCREGAQIEKMVSAAPRNHKATDTASLLDSFPRRCPPGGETAAVLYTTTLRGIRKTFEDCNAVRAAVETQGVSIVERDISMDSGYREELRLLMGRREVRVPALFVRGRLVGGVEEVLNLEEEGKLSALLAGMPRAAAWCDGCGGVRFVVCMDCSGSCKVLDQEVDQMVRCSECNENGLIRCPICC